MNDDSDPLSAADIYWRVSIVADGTAAPEEARELISEFVRQARRGKIEPALIDHVANCFAAFLVGEKRLDPSAEAGRHGVTPVPIATLEKAFGLTRVTRGRPPVDSDTQSIVAMQVLKRMLLRETLEIASEFVAEERRAAGLSISSETDVREAWAKHKADGLLALRLSRLPDIDPTAPPWTTGEIERLTEMFGTEPWFCPPGADPKAHMDSVHAKLDSFLRPAAKSAE